MASIVPNAESFRIVRTDQYMPYHVAVAPDGTAWTVGLELADETEAAANRDNGVLRHFDKAVK